MKKWTKQELQWVRENAHLGEPGLAKALGLDQGIIRAVLRNHKIRTGNKTQFTKGMNPWNAGKHLRLGVKGEFKKGLVPANTLHDGAITIRKDRSGKPYKFIRLAVMKWVHLHRVVWERAYGSIPKDKLIRFRNGDTLDCSIENLSLISRSENLAMNSDRTKVAAGVKESWENLSRYENDSWVAKLMAPGDKELQDKLISEPQLLEVKRQQLLLKRKLNTNHESFSKTENAAR